jgi:hypothetical protein
MSTTVQQTSGSSERNVNGKIMEQAVLSKHFFWKDSQEQEGQLMNIPKYRGNSSRNTQTEKARSPELKKLAGGNHLMNLPKYSGNSIASFSTGDNLTAGRKEGNSKQQAQVEVTNHHQWPVIVSLAAGPTTSTSVQQTSVSTERNVNGKIMEQA